MKRYQNEIPAGSISLTRFAWLHGVPLEVMASYAKQGKFEFIDKSIKKRIRRYFTPEQQQKALAFLECQGISCRPGMPAESAEVRPETPSQHTLRGWGVQTGKR